MRNIYLILAILFIAASPLKTSADEGPADSLAPRAEPPHERTGWYFGENAGYSWGESDIGYEQDPRAGSIFDVGSGIGRIINGDGELHPHSATGGVQGGYDYQAGVFVYGLVADFNYRRGGDQIVFGVPLSADSLILSTKQEWHGTVRARLGFYPSNAWLIYTTGGFAYGRVEHSVTQLISFDPFEIRRSFSSSLNKVGWTVGTGAEYQFSRSWSVGIEYSYTDLGTDKNGAGLGTGSPDIGFGDLFPVTRASYNDAYHIARVMLNFRFGGSQ